MADYVQYDGSVSVSVPQRLLDNGSDYITLRVNQYDTLIVQGKLSKDNNIVEYNGESWVYNSRDGTLTYIDSDSGRLTLVNDSYVYSSLKGYQRLSVNDVYPRFIFITLLAVILIIVGFNVVKKRWIL